jgi:hypothetical protein
MQSLTELYTDLSPLIQAQIQAALSRYSTSSVGSGTSIDIAAFLRKTGDIITGNIGVTTGVTIDGVDIDVLNSYAVPASLSVSSVNAQSLIGHTHGITSSANPGAAISILASDTLGLLQLTGFGAGVAPAAGQIGVLGTGAQVKRGYDATRLWTDTVNSGGDLTLDPLPATADMRVNADIGIGGAVPTNQTEQLRIAYDDDTYASHNVDVDGVYTIRTTSVPATGAYMLLNPGGPVGVNTSGRPNAQVEIVAITQQLRLSYSSGVYATHTVSSAGNYTIGATGANIYTTNHLAHPSYVSQLARWRISNTGEADFRYLYVDELHAKAFIADLEQALAGGQIVSKSVSKIATDLILVDAGSNTSLYVEEFAGFPGFHVFADGDLIRMRQFDRSGGGLKIADAWGTVVYLDQVAGSNPPAQWYLFNRHPQYPGTASGTIKAGTLALDYGASGNGYLEQNAIDGLNAANSPYYQLVTWAEHPKSTNANEGLKLRFRLGQLRGLTGVDQWGLYAGTGWTANPQEANVNQYGVITPTVNDAHRYIIAGDNGVDIYNANLNIYSSTTPVITLKRNGPSLAIGAGSDTIDYLTTNGIWMGLNSGAYKMRVGTVSGGSLVQGFSFDGSVMTVAGTINVLGGNALTTALINANGKLGTSASPAGNGLHLGGTLMGYYGSGQWITYMDSTGNFVFRGTPSASANVGALWWDVATYRLRGGYFAPAAGPDYGAFTEQWYTDSLTGAIVAGAGKVALNASGITLITSTAYANESSYTFAKGGVVTSELTAWEDATNGNFVGLYAREVAGRKSYVQIKSEGNSSYDQTIFISAGQSGGSSAYISLIMYGGAGNKSIKYHAPEVGHEFDGDVSTDGYYKAPQRTLASNAAGNAGQIAWDSNYIYVCTATNTWKRTALSTY